MKPTEPQFLKDVEKHELIVLLDDGVNRHIRLKAPGTMIQHFDLITWPGYLCYTGDMGTYVFRRLNDMFEFFRTDANSDWLKRKGLTLGINPGYWGEKLESVDGAAGYKEFDDDKFNRIIKDWVLSWARDNAYRTTKAERRDLWDDVISNVIESDGDSGGHRKTAAAYDFRHRVNAEVKDFCFQDLWEHDLEDYTGRFMWCCYALAWGIQKYDAAKVDQSLLHGH